MIEIVKDLEVAGPYARALRAIRRGTAALDLNGQRAATARDVMRWCKEKGIESLAADINSFTGAGSRALRLLPQSFFLSADFEAFAAEFRGANIQEIHRHSLYSYEVYPAAGSTEILFFSKNIGGAVNGLGDTNMQVGGQMSGNESMIIMNIRVLHFPSQTDYDAANTATPVAFGQWLEVLIRNCWLVLEIADKPYVTVGPLAMFPSGIGPGSVVSGAATVVRNVSFPSNGDNSNRSLWVQDPPLAVLPSRTLRLYMRWRALLTVTTVGKIGAVLDGYRIRAIQ